MSEAIAIEEQIRNSAAYRASARIEGLAQSLFIFSRNYEDLKLAIDGATDPERILPVWDIDRRADLGLVLMEIRRLLHNCLASAKTLVDQTRVMMTEAYENHPFLGQYQTEIDRRFAGDPLASFIQGLRNYMLHYGLPATFSNLSISRNAETNATTIQAQVTLKKESLVHWSSWPPPAREYLNGSANDIPVLAAIEPYQLAVVEFHGWLRNELLQVHAEELAWLEDMFKRRDEARGEL